MFRTQEDLELVLLYYMLEFNETRAGCPGVVVYKGYKETKTGILLETFPVCGTQVTPVGASSRFHLSWEELEILARRLNVRVTS